MGIVDPNSVTNTQAELNAIPEAKIPVSNPVMEGFTEGVGHATEIAGNIAPWLVPGGALVEAPLIAGARMYDAAQNQENSVPGAVGLGALEGIAMAAVPAAAGRLLAPVRQGLGGLAGGIAEGGAVGATLPAVSAGVSQMSGDPERAQQELGGIGTSAGVGGLLGAMLSRGKVAPGTGPRQPMTDQGSPSVSIWTRSRVARRPAVRRSLLSCLPACSGRPLLVPRPSPVSSVPPRARTSLRRCGRARSRPTPY